MRFISILNKVVLLGIVLSVLSTGCGTAPVDKPARSQDFNWPAFMSQHDMTFDKLPARWQEAPHFGNAMVGSMLYKSGDTIRLQVFRADVQDHRDDTWGWTAYSRPRFQIGYFELTPVGKLTGCKWRKDLWNAELTGTITTDKGEIRIRHFTHAVDMAIVTELTPTDGEKGCSWSWHPAKAATTRPGYPKNEAEVVAFSKKYSAKYAQTLKSWQPNPAGRQESDGRISLWIQDLLVGGQYAVAWGEELRGDTRKHIVSIANSYPGSTAASTARSDVGRFLSGNSEEWIKAHEDWWHKYYQRSFITIPDKSLESLYWQTIYRYGCTARAGRSMVDTTGIWFQGGPWPYITTDWNIQSAHWGVCAANRLEQGEEVVNRLHEGRAAMIQAVHPAEWQKDSAYLAIAVAPDMIGFRDGDMRYYDLVGNLPWTLNNAWSQYRFSMDDTMLRDTIYPLLRRSVNLYLHMVKEGDDGRLHLPPTYSPESGVWKDCNFDLALFKWGCLTLLKASKRLGIDDPLIPKWLETAARLPDFPVCEEGFKQGSDKPLLKHHRHLSHLLMIYPLYLVNIDQDGAGDVLRKSVFQAYDLKGSDSLAAMVQTHAGPMATALGEGDLALKGVKSLQSDLLPNGLWACAGNPCIESTLSIANNIQDMLIQSWSDPAKDEPGVIRIFPALPAEWKDVEFRDLRTEGAFLVSAKRAGGQTQYVRIKSLAGEPCLVRPGIADVVCLKGGKEHKLREVRSGIYDIELKKGEEVLLQKSASPLPAVIIAGEQSPKQQSQAKAVQEAGSPVTVRGKLFKVDTAKRSCELLKETVIDPSTNEGESRWRVQWRDDARLTKVLAQNSFTGVTGTVWAHFRQLNPAESTAVADGRPFSALKVTILAENESRAGLTSDERNILVQFTPDSGSEGLRSGVAKIGGKDVPVRLRSSRPQVELHLPATADELGRGFWEGELKGKRQADGTFIADSMQLYQLVDPRDIDDPKLPRILVVGDSISMNYHDAAKSALKGIANYYRVEGNAGPSDRGVSCMELWLGDYTQPGMKWDLIQFNHGLHDLKQLYNTNSGEYGAYQISIKEYQSNIEKEIAIMKKTGATLMWCSTTPVPNNSDGVWDNIAMGRKKDADIVFNEAALEVVKRHPEILINDLNLFVRNSPAFDDWRKQKDVHFWDQRTSQILGQAVADALKNALKQRSEK